MNNFLTFLKFAIKSFGMPFSFLIFIIILTCFIYLLLYFYFEKEEITIKKTSKKNLIKKWILKRKSKKYGIKTEVFEKIYEKTAP